MELGNRIGFIELKLDAEDKGTGRMISAGQIKFFPGNEETGVKYRVPQGGIPRARIKHDQTD
jgi:hypothetical protein